MKRLESTAQLLGGFMSTNNLSGRFLSLHSTADGWEYVSIKDGRPVVATAATDQSGRLVLISQYRPPVRQRVLELPAGIAESDDIEAEATREFEEETGRIVQDMELLSTVPMCPGLTHTQIHIFAARSAGTGSSRIFHPEPSERSITQVILPLSRLLDSRDGLNNLGMIDNIVYAAVFYLSIRLPHFLLPLE